MKPSNQPKGLPRKNFFLPEVKARTGRDAGVPWVSAEQGIAGIEFLLFILMNQSRIKNREKKCLPNYLR